jgi:small subunit ribosomal protein S16
LPVKIRLRRMGAKHQPSYRIVIADSRSPRSGRYLDQVGFYNPLTNPATITIDQEKAIDWLRRGAQPNETVLKLLSKFNIEPTAVRRGETPVTPDVTPAPSPRTSNRSSQGATATATETAPVEDATSSLPGAGETTLTLEPGEAPEVTETTE